MNLARSTFYDKPAAQSFGDAKIVEKIGEICADYPRYGYRRVTAQLHREGLAVNHKRAMRIMREQGLSVRPRRRFVVTTNSDHDGPIFPNLARELIPTGPNELWVADLTYIAIASDFVYLAVILDAWSRRVVGYALGRAIDTRLTLAALRSAIMNRRPPPGCVPARPCWYAAPPAGSASPRSKSARRWARQSLPRRAAPRSWRSQKVTALMS